MARKRKGLSITGLALLIVFMVSGCSFLLKNDTYTLEDDGWYIKLNIDRPLTSKAITVSEYDVTGLAIEVRGPNDEVIQTIDWKAEESSKTYLIPVEQQGEHEIIITHISNDNGEVVEAKESATFYMQAMVITVIDITPGLIGLINIEAGAEELDSNRILVDASRDGGVWWFPQGVYFSESEPHQGKALADFIRSRGFQVDELPRGETITSALLDSYNNIIRAGDGDGNYLESELQAYTNFLDRQGTSLILISEYKRTDEKDELAEMLGISFSGIIYGNITDFAEHFITRGATPFYYNAGSIIVNASDNPSIKILGWVCGRPVMGILEHQNTKIFFIGDINGIEDVPQPLVTNLISWAFE